MSIFPMHSPRDTKETQKERGEKQDETKRIAHVRKTMPGKRATTKSGPRNPQRAAAYAPASYCIILIKYCISFYKKQRGELSWASARVGGGKGLGSGQRLAGINRRYARARKARGNAMLQWLNQTDGMPKLFCNYIFTAANIARSALLKNF